MEHTKVKIAREHPYMESPIIDDNDLKTALVTVRCLDNDEIKTYMVTYPKSIKLVSKLSELMSWKINRSIRVMYVQLDITHNFYPTECCLIHTC